jgi:hypothetical protein
MRWRAQRRDVLPNLAASFRSDSGRPLSELAWYAAAAAASMLASPGFPVRSARASWSRPGPGAGTPGPARASLVRCPGPLSRRAWRRGRPDRLP